MRLSPPLDVHAQDGPGRLEGPGKVVVIVDGQ